MAASAVTSPAAVAAEPTARADAGRRFAVVDIGSNSVRLVVYDGLRRSPLRLFDEKVTCKLGLGLARTQKLSRDGMARALANLPRFVAVARAMGAGTPEVLATAAVREAENGAAFVAEVERRCGVSVRVIDGDEEARLAALGLLSGIPTADGAVGDLGGGSLELVALDRGTLGNRATLPLGPLRLIEGGGPPYDRARRLVDGHLAGLPWLAGQLRDRTFYAVGGAWRALATIHMAQIDHPIRIVHHHVMSRKDAQGLAQRISGLDPRAIKTIPEAPNDRLDTLPLAALTLERLLKLAKPAQVVFSANGLREGLVFASLPEEERREDPLLAACAAIARETGRSADDGDALFAWTAPLFPSEPEDLARLRRAACLIGEIGAEGHPRYRAEQAMRRVSRVPLSCLDHPSRAFLGLTALARYGGEADEEPEAARLKTLLAAAEARRARVLGLALRLGRTISGGAVEVLGDTELRPDGETLRLVLRGPAAAFDGEVVHRRLSQLARALDRRAALETDS
ncbi:MAG TPA: Ppx/GppA family phosphatase [Geminicoccaceae bacterium]|nr:Ppx/GppA family phosphatase [Geminicoccaceae bacterium]